MQDQKNRGQRHGQDQGQMPNRNRSDIQETPEQDVNTEPRQPDSGNPNRAGEQNQKDNRGPADQRGGGREGRHDHRN